MQIARKVGVYVITNREHPKFSECITAIKREMKDFPFYIIKDGKTRAEGRQICIDDARKRGFDWICFVDDDFVLNDGWWADVSPHMDDPKVGMIWGINWDHDDTRKNWINYLNSITVPRFNVHIMIRRKLDRKYDKRYQEEHPPQKASNLDYPGYLEHEFEQRGGTHDTLIRLDAIPEWIKIPRILHVYEDKFLKQIVEMSGYKCVITQTGGIHYNMTRWDGKAIMNQFDHDKVFYHGLIKRKDRIISLIFSPIVFYFRYKSTKSLRASLSFWWYHYILYNLKCILLLPQIYNLDPEPINMMLLMFEGKTCYDIGANMGYTSIILSRNFENVYAFEPSTIYKKLKKNVSRNKKIHALNIAISNHDGKLVTEKREIPWESGQLVADGGTIKDAWGKLIGKVIVDCRKIDSMDILKPDFMKIDVEGFELDVIKGALQTIRKYKPSIFIEVHSSNIGSEIKNILNSDYQIYHVNHPHYKENAQIRKEHYFLFCIPKLT
ncbi:MAG: FkbM family methyltransferase [Nitrososphaera sp.]